jgi:hypothetical protein
MGVHPSIRIHTDGNVDAKGGQSLRIECDEDAKPILLGTLDRVIAEIERGPRENRTD